MDWINNKLPDYVCKKQNIVGLIIFTAAFALLFINLYKPFDSRNWYPDITDAQYILFSSFLILVGVFVVAISRMLMYFYSRKHPIHYWEFGIWVLAEIMAMSAIYSVFTEWASDWHRAWGDVILESLENTLLVLLLPYAISLLYESWEDKNRQLKALQATSHSELANASPAAPPVAPMVALFDENNELRLSIKRENLLYIESADNYVYIWYLNKGQVSKFLLRNSLKSLEERFNGTSVMRCHRSYMVNFDNVAMIRREKDGIYIEFSHPGIDNLPVSKTYAEAVTKAFLKNVAAQ
jgi:DNA-binding LytR/AlgR family response regulator